MGGCTNQKNPDYFVSENNKVVDDLGEKIDLFEPNRVVVCGSSLAEIWLLAGGELTGITQDAYEDNLFQISSTVVNVGSLKTPSLEQIIALEPDLVILSSRLTTHLNLKDSFSELGISTFYCNVEQFEDYLSVLKAFTQFTGQNERYVTYGENIASQIENIKAQIDSSSTPEILFLRAYSGGVTAKNSNSMTGHMLKDLGCINIADNKQSLLEDLSMEAIIQEDPKFIFVVTMGNDEVQALQNLNEQLISNPAWETLSAVKNDRYILLPKNLFHHKPNAKWAEAYQFLATLIYGE
jgi:iron complex transport system substrate-binding protein